MEFNRQSSYVDTTAASRLGSGGSSVDSLTVVSNDTGDVHGLFMNNVGQHC